MRTTALPIAALAALAVPAAHVNAQLSIAWSTIDAGGGLSAGGAYTLAGTLGQPDAATLASGTLTLRAGFWSAAGGACYANCDASTQAPALNVADFTCFLQRFAAGHAYANCDASTQAPTLNVADFTCFLQRFAAGCP